MTDTLYGEIPPLHFNVFRLPKMAILNTVASVFTHRRLNQSNFQLPSCLTQAGGSAVRGSGLPEGWEAPEERREGAALSRSFGITAERPHQLISLKSKLPPLKNGIGVIRYNPL